MNTTSDNFEANIYFYVYDYNEDRWIHQVLWFNVQKKAYMIAKQRDLAMYQSSHLSPKVLHPSNKSHIK